MTGHLFVALKRLHQGYRIPRGWGIAWFQYDRDIAVVMPLPLNWIAGWTRNAYYRLMAGPRECAFKAVYQRGFMDGEIHGRDIGRAETFDQLERAVGGWGPLP